MRAANTGADFACMGMLKKHSRWARRTSMSEKSLAGCFFGGVCAGFSGIGNRGTRGADP